MIGSIKFEKLDEIKKKAEFGYFLRKDAWSQGFMTEVVRKICQLSFEEFGLNNYLSLPTLKMKLAKELLLSLDLVCSVSLREVIATQEKSGLS